MKKTEHNYGGWKSQKRKSYKFYIIIFVMSVVVGAVGLAVLFSEMLTKWLANPIDVPSVVIIVGLSLIIGLIIAFFVGKVLFVPIKNLQEAMNGVTNGDFEIKVEEKSVFDEIENINHSFNIMMKELRANEVIQKDFVSNVSHEFKTPLNAIEGYATLLQEENLSKEEQNEYVQKILLNTKRMTELVSNVLLISRLENKAVQPEKSKFSLDEQIRQAVVLLEPKWQKKDIEFDVSLDESLYFGSQSLLSHVWFNLIENAIKFSPQGGKVTITLTDKPDKAVITFSDEGEGVKESEKDLIFQRFYQADTSHKQEGSGLGLALVKKILESEQGEIVVDNLPEFGCMFTVTLNK